MSSRRKIIYFSGSTQALPMPLKRTGLDAYSQLVCFLETLGAVKTASALFAKDQSSSTDVEKSQFFYEQICSLIRNADLVIVEVSTPSLRVGYEIAYAEAFSKPVLTLQNRKSLLYEDQPLSPFLRGNQRITICTYEHTDEAIAQCRSFFSKNCKRTRSRGVRIRSNGSKRWTDLRVQDLVPPEAGEDKMLWFHGDDKLDAVITGLSMHRYLCAPVYDASRKFIGLVDMQDVLAFVLQHLLSNNSVDKSPNSQLKRKTTRAERQPQMSGGRRSLSSTLPPIQNSRSSSRKAKPLAGETGIDASALADKIASMRKSGGILKSTYARDVINISKLNPCVPADPDTPLVKVMTTLAEGTYRVPIINSKGRVIRILSQMAMCELLAENLGYWEQEAKFTLPSPFRTAKVVKVSSDSTALDAFSKIQNATVTGVAIIDEEGRLIADLTPADLKSLNHVALLLDPVTNFTEGTPIRQVLTIPQEQTDRVTLKKVVQKMVFTGAHRFYILDSGGKPSAALSITDVLKGFTSAGSDRLWCPPGEHKTSKPNDNTTTTKVGHVSSVVIDGAVLESKHAQHSSFATNDSHADGSPTKHHASSTRMVSRKDKSRSGTRKARRNSQKSSE